MQQWYVEQCDGDWEHGYGVRIETLDNPGWIVAIRISETNAERLEVERTLVERTETDWLHVKTRDGSLEAACGPLNLEEALTTLRRILEDHLADPSSSTGRPAAAIAVLREGGFEERSSERERRIDRGGVTIVESPLLRIRLELSRGELFVDIAHPTRPDDWHDLRDLVPSLFESTEGSSVREPVEAARAILDKQTALSAQIERTP